jgi:nicotinamide-nucleotide amidase
VSGFERRSAALIATGDELLLGTTVDTNSAWLAAKLFERGWTPERFIVLGDDEKGLCSTIRELSLRHPLVVVTGGLGPTLDDVTRAACARAADVELVLDRRSLEDLVRLFESRGRPFAQANERQAWFPRGAEILPNPVGTAPGFALAVGGSRVFALPGPPREMTVMFEGEVAPRLDAILAAGEACASASLYLFGLSESAFADQCGAWMARGENPLVGVTASRGVLSVRLRASGADEDQARQRLDQRLGAMRERFGAWIFDERDPDPASVLGRELLARGVTVTTAESCTGGLLAEKLTRVPGISAVFGEGFVTYSDRAKSDVLGVDPELVRAHGAVSSEVAAALARGAAEKSGARLALSITGIAGPGGGSATKPVGLVWLGVSFDGRVETHERHFVVRGRQLVREFAANTACDLALRRLREG